MRSRVLGAAAILVVLAIQSYYALQHCDISAFALWPATFVALAPAILFLLAGRSRSVVGACIVILLAVVWANDVECVQPYEGGGAAMAYVLVFLFGIPISLILGALIPPAADSPTKGLSSSE